MKTCIKCGSHAFNLYAEGIDQGGLCDVHYWQGRAHRAEAQPEQEPVAIELALAGLVEKITGGIDSGDLLADAVTASKMLDAQPKQPISVQPDQEPVAWMSDQDVGFKKSEFGATATVPLYTAPPKRRDEP